MTNNRAVCCKLFGQRMKKIVENRWSYYVSTDYIIMLRWNDSWQPYESLEKRFPSLVV